MTQLHTPTSNASNQETQDGFNTVKLVTPAGLYSSITSNGNVKQSLDNNNNATFISNFTAKTATNVETQEGILNNKLVTPTGLLSSINVNGNVRNAIQSIIDLTKPILLAGTIASGVYAIKYNDGTNRIEQYMRVSLGTDTNNTALPYLVAFTNATSINVVVQSYASVGASGGSRYSYGANSNGINTYTIVNDGAAADFFVLATGI